MSYPSGGELLDEGIHVCTNLTTRRDSDRKKGIDSTERAAIMDFLPLDCVGKLIACMTCCIPQIGAGARVSDSNIE